MAAPEPQLGYGLAGGVVSSVPAACTPSTEEIEIQSCAPTAENVCSTADVVSEEITYEKRCKEVVNKHCTHCRKRLQHRRCCQRRNHLRKEMQRGRQQTLRPCWRICSCWTYCQT